MLAANMYKSRDIENYVLEFVLYGFSWQDGKYHLCHNVYLELLQASTNVSVSLSITTL
jgi:hypothetical protein